MQIDVGYVCKVHVKNLSSIAIGYIFSFTPGTANIPFAHQDTSDPFSAILQTLCCDPGSLNIPGEDSDYSSFRSPVETIFTQG